MSVVATGTNLTYVWRKGGVALTDGGVINGQGTATLTLTNATTANAGSYDVVVSGTCTPAVTSNAVTVTVNTAPSITAQPTVPAATCSGSGTQTISVVATGTNLTYVWRKGGVAVTNGGVISGQGTATLTLTNPATTDAGSYDVVVSGTCTPAVTSNAVTVTVSAPSFGGTASANQIVCSGNMAADITLSGNIGSVVKWQKASDPAFTVGLQDISNATTTLPSATIGTVNSTTYFRAVVQSSPCSIAYSLPVLIAIDSTISSPITASPASVICLGNPLTLSTTGYQSRDSILGGDFNQANPAGWTGGNANNSNGGPNNNWGEATNGSGKVYGTYQYGSGAPSGNKYQVVSGVTLNPSGRDSLITPLFSTIGRTSLTLDWYQGYNFNGTASGQVQISIDGGSTWTTLATYNSSSPNIAQNPFNSHQTIDLNAYLGQANVKIKFLYTGTSGSAWALDDVNVLGPYQPLTYTWPSEFTVIAPGNSATYTPTAAGTFTYNLTTHGTCGDKTSSITITVSAPASITTQPAASAAQCVGSSASISATISGTPQWQVSTDGGTTWLNISAAPYSGFTTPTLNISATTLAMATYLYRVVASAPSPCSNSVPSNSVALKLKNVWTGATGTTDWNTGGNWSDGSVPNTTCPTVLIPVVALGNYPILSTGPMATITNLQIDAGASAKITGNTMQLAGGITNNGLFDVTDGTVEFNGTTGTQNIAGSNFKNNIPGKNNTVKNLIISNNVNVANTAGDTLNITGLVSFSIDNTTLTTGNNLTLKSTKDNTASIGALAANNVVSGQVEVERYINIGTTSGTHPKSWQYLATPTQGQTLKESWMENQSSTIVGYGAQFNGTLGTSGYDGAPSIAPSVKSWDEGTGAWKEFANTADLLYNPRGYYAFVRGDRSVDGTTVTTAKPTTLRSKGAIFTHIQPRDVPAQTANNVFFSIGNPYPSAVDMTKVQQTGTGITDTHLQFFYVWSPVLNEGYGVGGWNTLVWDGAHYFSVPGPVQNDMIQSGQAFLVQEDLNTDTKVIFTEDAKVSTNNYNPFRVQTQTGKAVKLATTLFAIQAGGNTILADGTLQMFDKSFTGKLDRYDARKIMNSANNLAIKTSSGVNLVVESRAPLTEQDTIRYNMSSMAKQNYRLEFKARGLSSQGVEGFIEDTYLNTRTPMDMEGITNVDFAVTSDKGSYAANRFRIVFKTAVVLPVKLVSVTAAQKDEDIRVDWKVENEKAVKQYVVEKATDGVSFKQAGIVAAANNESASYQWLDDKATPGDNYYRIRIEEQTGKISYSEVVKVAIPLGKPSIGIYPNPITDGIIHLQLVNQPKGRYGLRLLNPLGQTIIAKQVEHAGGNATENINWDYHLAHGVYQLQVLRPDGKTQVIKVMY
jgi:hypothetical protein